MAKVCSLFYKIKYPPERVRSRSTSLHEANRHYVNRTWWVGWLDFDYSLDQMRSLSPLAVAAVLTVGALVSEELSVAEILSKESRNLAREVLWPLDAPQSSSRNIMDLAGLLIVGTFIEFAFAGPIVQ